MKLGPLRINLYMICHRNVNGGKLENSMSWIIIVSSNTTHDADVDKLNFEFSNIPMPNTNVSYYNFKDIIDTSDLNDNGFQFSNVTLGDVRRSFRSIQLGTMK